MRITWAGTVSPFAVRRVGFRGAALQNMEHQAAGHRAGLGKPHLDLLRQAEHMAGPASGQRLLPFVVLPVIVRQRAASARARSRRSPRL